MYVDLVYYGYSMNGIGEEFVDVVGYNEDRAPDYQYHDLLETILKDGKLIGTQLEGAAWTVFGRTELVYDLRNGFPVITERDLSRTFDYTFAEITAFINGVHTVEDMEAWGNPWWDRFIAHRKTQKRGLPDGDMGPGSYGHAYNNFPTPVGATVNQITAIVDQIKANPQLRTHVATTIMPGTFYRAPGYKQQVVWTPCHGTDLHFRVLEDELHLLHVQRSADVPVGLVFNIMQYAGLQMVVGKITGYRPTMYIHKLADAHIYDVQSDAVEALLERDPRPFPRALVNVALGDVLAWRKEDIKITDYDPHPGMRVPTPED